MCTNKQLHCLWCTQTTAALTCSKTVAVQGGNYIAGVQPQSLRNLSDYDVFPFSDLQNQYDMNPVLGSCFANGSGLTIPSLVPEVNTCTDKYHICCYNAVNDQVRPMWHSSMLHSGSTST